MQKKYNIGLDIGTSSVGWAVVENDTFKVMKKGNHKLWGVRLFDEANPASDRRMFRSTRRRYDRRRKRINLLQKEFNEEIVKIDPDFYKKMKESFYQEKDKNNKTIILTKEEKEGIVKYNKKYPTIYHLRKELMSTNSKMDIRLVYLAIHHIIKYRGNFNYINNNFNVSNLNIKDKLKELFINMFNICNEIEFDSDFTQNLDYEELEKILLLESKIDRKKFSKDMLLNYVPKNTADELSKLFVGYQFSISKLFNLELEEDIKVKFDGTDYDDKYDSLEKKLDLKIEVLDYLKELYDMIYLKTLFKNTKSPSLSSLMVDKYNKHNDDLKLLKDVLSNNRKEYNHIFKTSNEKNICIYDLYISNKIIYDDLKKEILKSLLNIDLRQEDVTKKVELIKNELEKELFMPRITNSDNGKYPYQLNKDELVKIINNQGKYYPFLLDITNDGTYKLVKLLEFRIPYYVGPLNNSTNISGKTNDNAWIKKNCNDIITPYNFSEVVNLEASAEEFITRMISHCTYLLNEPAMPNNSILYSKYKVINELKQIKVNDYKIEKDIINKIYNDLFLKTSGTITSKIFKNYLRTLSDFRMYDELIITGYSSNEKFANNMQSYVDFFGNDGIFNNTSYTINDAENIIRYITIFEDKKILKTKVSSEYPNLDEKSLNKILNKKYSGWSELSEKLLTTRYYINKETNEHKSIMDLLEETNENFMQIINNDKYNFQKMIDDNNKINDNNKLDYSVVDRLATSPATKRGIYQSLKIVDELVKYLGYQPTDIMIEMARGEEKKQRKDTRKEYIAKLYQSFKSEINDYKVLNSQLTRLDKIDNQKLFLYFIQEGKSLYSQQQINIDELYTDKYEIDHIIPQTLIKDDSIDNKALVLRSENQLKSASYVLPKVFRTQERIKWWNHLKKCNLISNKKMYNLMRKEYNKEDIEGFINRQIVETRQITKHVANILKNYYNKTDVVYLNAGLSHNYRDKFELFKFRNINDYHHAHDAYLAAVLGEYRKYYLKDSININELQSINQKLYDEKRYKELRYGYVINSLDNNYSMVNKETGEIVSNKIFNDIVENTLYQNDIYVTTKTEIKTGQFYKMSKHKAGSGGVPLKDNMPISMYGSYSDIECSYMCLVEYNGKKKIVGIPLLIDIKSKVNPNIKDDFIRSQILIKKNELYRIIKDKIPFNTLLIYKNQKTIITGYSISNCNNELCNAVELNFDKNSMKKYKYILNHLLNNAKNEIITDYENEVMNLLNYLLEKINKNYPLYKNIYSNLLLVVDKIDLEEKEKVIVELLKMLSLGSANANLKELSIKGLSERTGRLNGNNLTSGKIIFQSITGIKEFTYEF